MSSHTRQCQEMSGTVRRAKQNCALSGNIRKKCQKMPWNVRKCLSNSHAWLSVFADSECLDLVFIPLSDFYGLTQQSLQLNGCKTWDKGLDIHCLIILKTFTNYGL